MRPLIIALPLISLSACANDSAQLAANAQAEDDAKCRSYGVAPGSPAYVQCRMNLDNQRAALARAAVGAFFANGGVR
jgi:hypothetical protein